MAKRYDMIASIVQRLDIDGVMFPIISNRGKEFQHSAMTEIDTTVWKDIGNTPLDVRMTGFEHRRNISTSICLMGSRE